MIHIRLKDCVVKGDSVEIRVIGKGRKIRKVIIPLSLFDEICSVYQGETWLFESKSGKQLNRNNVGVQIKKVGRRVGLSTSISPEEEEILGVTKPVES